MSQQPSNILNFNFYSEEDNRTYNGVFTLRRISVFGANEIQVLGNRITNGLGVNNTVHAEMVRFMAVIAHMVTDVKKCDWYDPENFIESWQNIFDIEVLNQLHKEVVAYDQWFRKGSKARRNQERSKEESNIESKQSIDTTNSLVRKESGDESEESGISEVVIG